MSGLRSLGSGLRAALLVTAKDLRQRVRDHSAWLFGVIVPLGLAVIFSLVLPSFGPGDVTVHLGVVGDSPTADEFADGLGGDGGPITAVERLGSRDAAVAELSADRIDVAMVIPPDLAETPGGTVDVLTGPDEAIAGQIGRSLAAALADRVDAANLTVAAATRAGAGPEQIRQAAQAAASASPPVRIVGSTTAARELDATTYLAAGMAVFFLFFTVQLGVTSLLEERQRGTLQRLRAAPIPPWAVVVGKLITSVVLGVVSMAVLIVATTVLLGAVWGDPAAVAVLTLAGVLAACSLVAVVGRVARTAEQAGAWQSILAIVLGMLGGAFFPVAQGPGLIAELTKLSPHTWYLRGLGDLAAGAGVAAVTTEVAALITFAAAGLALAALLPSRQAQT